MKSILIVEGFWASGLLVDDFDVSDETLEPLVIQVLLLL
jgi:hypothetical protein